MEGGSACGRRRETEVRSLTKAVREAPYPANNIRSS